MNKTSGHVLFCVCILVCLLWPPTAGQYIFFSSEQSAAEAKYLKILRQIYAEVKEFGQYPGEDFVRREFFIGNADDDDTYKNQHVVVLIQSLAAQEKMRLQVTYMEPTKDNPRVKLARNMKNISCQVIGGKVTVQTSDFDRRELEKITLEILRAIQDKKKILKSLKL